MFNFATDLSIKCIINTSFIMKKALKVLSLFVMVASMALISSCSKEKSIVGKWKFSSATVEISNVDPEIQEYLSDYLTAIQNGVNADFKDMVWEFKSDNTMTASGEMIGTDSEKITYSLNNNKLTLTNPEADEDEKEIVFDVITLDDKNLVVSYSEEITDEKGMIVKETLSFTRI